MEDLKLPIRIALQNFAWEKYKITVPNFVKLLEAYLKKSGHQAPVELEQIDSFLNDGFNSYLQPIEGFICSRIYNREILDQHGIVLNRLPSESFVWVYRYKDLKYGLYWEQFVSGHDSGPGPADVPPFQVVLIGSDNLPKLGWS